MKPEDIIIAPVITEKSNDELQAGKYTFEVNKKATKIDVKYAVEKLFEVKVIDVNTMMNKGNENVEVSLNSLLLHFGTDGGYNEARSFNSSEKKTSKNYFVEKLEPGKKLNVNVAYVAEDKQLNEYKDQLYLMTVLSGNPLGEGTMQVIKSEK